MGALVGLGVGGMIGGLIGALVGMGIQEQYEAKRYEGRIKVLLSVRCDQSDEIKRAKELLTNTGAEDISSTDESSADYPATNKVGARVWRVCFGRGGGTTRPEGTKVLLGRLWRRSSCLDLFVSEASVVEGLRWKVEIGP